MRLEVPRQLSRPAVRACLESPTSDDRGRISFPAKRDIAHVDAARTWVHSERTRGVPLASSRAWLLVERL